MVNVAARAFRCLVYYLVMFDSTLAQTAHRRKGDFTNVRSQTGDQIVSAPPYAPIYSQTLSTNTNAHTHTETRTKFSRQFNRSRFIRFAPQQINLSFFFYLQIFIQQSSIPANSHFTLVVWLLSFNSFAFHSFTLVPRLFYYWMLLLLDESKFNFLRINNWISNRTTTEK